MFFNLNVFFFSFMVLFLIFPFFIRYMVKKTYFQSVSQYLPQSHQKKAKTPSMGGILIGLNIIILNLIFNDHNYHIIVLLISIFLLGFLGFFDDFLKIKERNNKGFSIRKKLLLQTGISIFIAFLLIQTDLFFQTAEKTYLKQRQLQIPFLDWNLINWDALSFLVYSGDFVFRISFLEWIFYTIILVSTVNSVNITDGLDGLLSSTLLSSFLGLFVISVFLSAQDISLFLSITTGTLLAFFFYNRHPAQIFMGDTGSLLLGGILAILVIFLDKEFLLIFLGFIFIIESLSVILQLLSYKYRKKAIFLMSPIHHHFEKKGLNENQIVLRFSLVALFFTFIALLDLL